MLETSEKAKQKNLSLVAGFCWRYNNMIQDTFQQVESGAIGKLVAYYATYYTSPVKPMPPASARPAGMSDVEWQIRNWYNFVWLCGDSLVEQAVHSADKIAWAMHDEPPVSCVAVGGRVIPAEGGNIYDHFEINYIYPNGVRAFLANRQIVGCYNENSDYMLGADGTCTIGRGPHPRIEGKTNWTFTGQQYNMYQREHDLLFASIRKNQPMNDGKRMAASTMLAMMGRMAAYTGQEVTWDQAMNSQEKLFPDHLEWNGSLPFPPAGAAGRHQVGLKAWREPGQRCWPRFSQRPEPPRKPPRPATKPPRSTPTYSVSTSASRPASRRPRERPALPTGSPFRTPPSRLTWSPFRPASSGWARRLRPPQRRTNSRSTRCESMPSGCRRTK